MNCDYYVKSKLVIEYLTTDFKYSTIYTNIDIKKGYIYKWDNYDSDDDLETSTQKYRLELERQMKDNTYDKILCNNGKWVKESYQKKYENYLMRNYREIHYIVKVYKRKVGMESGL